MANPDSSNQINPDVDVSQPETAAVEASARPGKPKRSDAAPKTSRGAKRVDHSDTPKTTKAEAVLKKLKGSKGATIEALVDATGW